MNNTELDDNSIEYKIQQKNKAYYDFMARENRTPGSHAGKKEASQKRAKSFAQREVNFRDLPLAPKGYESVFYPLYILLVPYTFGYIFLSLAVAQGNFTNNPFLSFDNFLIVWVVGYEIFAVFALIWIAKLFFEHDPSVY